MALLNYGSTRISPYPWLQPTYFRSAPHEDRYVVLVLSSQEAHTVGLDMETGLFQNFPRRTSLERLAKFDVPSWQCPCTCTMCKRFVRIKINEYVSF
jgi:hypothetical protein